MSVAVEPAWQLRAQTGNIIASLLAALWAVSWTHRRRHAWVGTLFFPVVWLACSCLCSLGSGGAPRGAALFGILLPRPVTWSFQPTKETVWSANATSELVHGGPPRAKPRRPTQPLSPTAHPRSKRRSGRVPCKLSITDMVVESPFNHQITVLQEVDRHVEIYCPQK